MKKNLGLVLILALVFITLGMYVKQQIDKDQALNPSALGQAIDLNNAQVGLKQGETPPDFTLETLDGEEITLSELKGKKVVLNFWASWCPPCKAEMPHMQKYYKNSADTDNVEIVAVNLTNRENKEKLVQDFINSYKITFPIPLDRDGTIAKQFKIITIPSTYMIDSNGKVQHAVAGPVDVEMLETYVKGLD